MSETMTGTGLETTYMGLRLRSPLVASASPLTRDPLRWPRLEAAGVGAIVLPSLFQEQIEAEQEWAELRAGQGAEASPEASAYFPAAVVPEGPAVYLDMVRHAAHALSVPVIASLNGTSPGTWTSTARALQDAGAAGLELNLYDLPTDLALTSAEVEDRHLETLVAVKEAVSIPVAVKLTPWLSAPGDVAQRLDRAGADALVLFNRTYLPDVDTVTLRSRPSVELSRGHEIRLPMLWISILAGHVRASLAATTGVETAEEVVKYLLAGADVVMTTSALLRHGPDYAAELLAGLRSWLEARHFDSVDAMRGLLSRERAGDHAVSERQSYMQILSRY